MTIEILYSGDYAGCSWYGREMVRFSLRHGPQILMVVQLFCDARVEV